MDRLNRLLGIFRRQEPAPEAPRPLPDAPDKERVVAFQRFMHLDPLLTPGQGPLHAAVVMGAFCNVMFRIVARHGETETTVEVEGLDVTTRPVEPRQNDYEYLGRLAREARLVHERAVVSPEALARFRGALGPGEGFELTDDLEAGFDGYTMRAVVSDGRGRTHRFGAWSPREQTPCYRFLQALHGLASESLQGWRALNTLDSLHDYAQLGERFRDFGGTPRLVKLWGFADSEAQGLGWVERLRRLPDTEPIVLDLRWFHGPPVVVKEAMRWAAERPDVRVVVPGHRFRMKDSGVPAERMFELLEQVLGADH